MYRVAFRKDAQVDGTKGDYHLSSKEFQCYDDARSYADTISESREPVVLMRVQSIGDALGV